MYMHKFIIGKEGIRCQIIVEKIEVIDKKVMKKQDNTELKIKKEKQVKAFHFRIARSS